MAAGGVPASAGLDARSAALADLVLRDHEDGEVRLGDLWADSTAVLVWLRHYG